MVQLWGRQAATNGSGALATLALQGWLTPGCSIAISCPS